MKDRVRGKKRILFLLLTLLLLAMAGETVWAANTQNVVASAKKNRVSGGKWVKNQSGLRYRKKNGTYLRNTRCYIGGSVYCFDANGYVKTKAFKYNGQHYYADSQGRLYVNRWRNAGNKCYYYGSDGARVKGWKTIRGKKYYFFRTGELVTKAWVGNNYVGGNGVRVTNKTVDGRKINKSGELQKISSKDRYIIVGASRIVDMSVAVSSPDTVFIAKSGMGYQWLKNTAGPKLMSYLKQNPRCKVMFQLGNNDVKNIHNYISYYKSLMRKFPSTEFYFMDATPGTAGSGAKNTARKKFNAQMKSAFGNLCVGGYDYMISIHYTTLDGVHYPHEVSRKLYDYTIRMVNKVSASKKK